ncbi:hypothetical protein ACLI4Z_04315 [Natrialbaceae archaeon A-arb3/5]
MLPLSRTALPGEPKAAVLLGHEFAAFTEALDHLVGRHRRANRSQV